MKATSNAEISFTSDMILLDIVSRWPTSEMLFRRYDEKAGVCLCCTYLFDTVKGIAERFALNLTGLMKEIKDAVAGKKHAGNN
jgi:hypothetical protein